MLTRSSLLTLAATLTTAVAVLAPEAGAATYCVSAPGCIGTAKTFPEALAASDATVAIDDIVLGAGTYQGNFANKVGRPVRIKGAGIATKIQPVKHDAFALSLHGPSTLIDVQVQLLGLMHGYEGLKLDAGARAERVRVVSLGAGGDSQTAVELGVDAVLTGSEIYLTPRAGTVGVIGSGDGATLDNVSVTAATGVRLRQDALVRRVRVASTIDAIETYGGDLELQSALLDVRGGGHGLTVWPQYPAYAARVDASHVTVIGANIAEATAFKVAAGADAMDAHLRLRDSIVAGMPVFTHRFAEGRASITVDHTYRPVGAKLTTWPGGGSSTYTETERLWDAPKFVSAAHDDFALAPGSALVDAGSDAPAAAGELDLAGRSRIADGNGDCVARRDPGAYETPAGKCGSRMLRRSL